MPYRDLEKRRATQKAWRARNVDRHRAAQREAQRRYTERRQPTAIPQKMDTPGYEPHAGLSIVCRGTRPSDWREDAAQDRALAQLEAAARRGTP